MKNSNRKADSDRATSSAHLPATTLAHSSLPTPVRTLPSALPLLTSLETTHAYTSPSLIAMQQTLPELGIPIGCSAIPQDILEVVSVCAHARPGELSLRVEVKRWLLPSLFSPATLWDPDIHPWWPALHSHLASHLRSFRRSFPSDRCAPQSIDKVTG